MRKFLVTSMVGGVMAAGALLMPANAAGGKYSTPVADITAQGDPTTQTGAIIVDGNGTVPGPIGGGYIGVDSNEGVVGCATGTYTGSGDNVITKVPPPAAAPAPPDPNSTCTPTP
ncbi:MAG: hypothetical protein QOH64_2421 [Acidimicrobiaceae bacterium]